MRRRAFLWTALILLYEFASGDKCDDLDEILHTTLSTLKDIVNGINSKIEELSGKFDFISKEVVGQKSAIEDVKRSIGTSEKGRQTVESFHLKQLKDQNATMIALQSHSEQLAEIKSMVNGGFSKAQENQLNTSEINNTLFKVSGGIENLSSGHRQLKTKLGNLHETLKQETDSIDRAILQNAKKTESLLNEVSKSLLEQSQPLSTAALTHVNKVDAFAKSTASDIKKFDDLEPKLTHVLRLSEDIQNNLSNNPIVNNLTVSLQALKNSAPSIVSSASKNVNELEGALQDLKAMSKDNNCPVNFTSEIRDHHRKIMKYLNETVGGSKNKEQELWNDLMRKFEDAVSDKDGDINGKLVKLRGDIGDIREILRQHSEESEISYDTVFG